MSVQSISLVLEHSLSEGTARLVLISIANHDGEGGCWPSVATIGREARRSERSVQMALKELVELGELVIHRNDGGTHKTRGDRRPNRYEITIDPACQDINGVQSAAPRDDDNGVQHAAPRPDSRGAASGSHGVQTSAPEPSLTIQDPPSPGKPGAIGCAVHPGGKPNCRACGTTPRQLAAKATAEASERRRLADIAAAAAERAKPKSDPAETAAGRAAARAAIASVRYQGTPA